MKVLGLAAGVAAFALFMLTAPPEGLSPTGWRVAGVFAWIVIWWLSEAVPLAVTAALPMLLFPFLGIGPPDQIARSYASPLMGLVFGGAMIGIATAKVGLHRKLATVAVRLGGGGPRRLVLALMVTAALLGMWMVSTIVVIIMLQVAVALIAAVAGLKPWEAVEAPDAQRFARAAILGIAYAAGFGGLSSLIGNPVNAIAVGMLARQGGPRLEFLDWLAFGLPFAAIAVVATWAILVGVAFRFRVALPPRETLVAALGVTDAPRSARVRVLAVAGITLLGLVTLPLTKPLVPMLSDSAIVLTGALMLFVLPAGGATGKRLLDWDDARDAPWGVLVLLGGALALSAALSDSGLAAWLAAPLQDLGGAPPWLALLGLVAGVAVLTELVNNFAAVAIAVPAATTLAAALGVDPVAFVVAVTLAAGGGYIVPGPPWLTLAVGTAPARVSDLARGGVWLILMVPALLTAICLAIAG